MYRNIYSKIHYDQPYRSLSHGAKLLFLTMITSSSSHPVGLFRYPDPMGQDEADYTHEEYQRYKKELIDAGLIIYDPEYRLLLIRNMWKYQHMNANQRKGALQYLYELKDSQIVIQFLSVLTQNKNWQHQDAPQLQDKKNPSETVSINPSGTVTEGFLKERKGKDQERKGKDTTSGSSEKSQTSFSTIGDVAQSVMQSRNVIQSESQETPQYNPGPAPAMIRGQPSGELEVVLTDLKQEYGKLWGYELEAIECTGANLNRWRQALTDGSGNITGPLIEKAKAAIKGHRIMATKDGSKLGKSFGHVAPAGYDARGNYQIGVLNRDRYAEFARAGGFGKRRKKPKREVDKWREQGDTPEAPEERLKVGVAGVKRIQDALKSYAHPDAKMDAAKGDKT